MVGLTEIQSKAFEQIIHFLHDENHQVFVLSGSAGTGKTTLVGKLAEWLDQQEKVYDLLASTGRAAKVLNRKTGKQAQTLHSCVYSINKRLNSKIQENKVHHHFTIRENIHIEQNHIFIVDEASMLTHEIATVQQAITYGTGSVLKDFFTFVDGRKVIFVGDSFQLPPVGKNTHSVALDIQFLNESMGIPTTGMELTEIIRQQADSGILKIAQPFRDGAQSKQYVKYPKINLILGKNIRLFGDYKALEAKYFEEVKQRRYLDSVMIVQSNWHVANINEKVRSALHGQRDLQVGDMLMVVQNAYHVPFSNGDQVIVESVEFDSVHLGFTFLRVKIRDLKEEDTYESLLIADLLYNDKPGLTHYESNRLLYDFDKRMRKEGIKPDDSEYLNKLYNDKYLNALRTKFGYAITCHKAQGGEWPNVYLNINKSLYRMDRPSLYRWFYTAITRAKEQIFINDGWWVKGYNYRTNV